MTLTCKQPDRDVPRMMCGYPLPCPHHTLIADVAKQTVTVPLTQDAGVTLAAAAAGRVGEVVTALKPERAKRRRK